MVENFNLAQYDILIISSNYAAKNTNMKILLLAIVLTFSLSCSNKKDLPFCWRCVVDYPGEDRVETPCTETDAMPAFYDSNGNPLQAGCVRR